MHFIIRSSKINSQIFFSHKIPREKYFENVDCDWGILLSIHNIKLNNGRAGEFCFEVTVRLQFFCNFWVKKMSCYGFLVCSNGVSFGHNICAVISPLLMKQQKYSAIIAHAFLNEHASPLTGFMNSHMFSETFYNMLICLTKHMLAVQLFTEMLLFYSPSHTAYLDDSSKII